MQHGMKNQLLQAFARHFGDDTTPLIVRSPGRINLIGEHTDYNGGFVLPAAIDKAAYLAISLRPDNEIHLFAQDLNESFSCPVNELRPIGDVSWPNYLLGVVAQFRKAGIEVPGFHALLQSDIPMGSGLSSSAAIECAVAFGLNELLGAGLSRMELVRMAQLAEHEFAGVQCGIMDQFASMMGHDGQAMKLDCRLLEFEYVPVKLSGYSILLLNSNVKHSLASSEYNTRRRECEQAVQWVRKCQPDVASLRDVDMEMLTQYVLPNSELIYRRARFIVEENQRLLGACLALEQGNIAGLGQHMYGSHDGLSHDYEVSCKELDWLVGFVRPNAAVAGARMMGGGFGGCTINLVREEAVDALIAAVTPAYEAETGLPLTHYRVGIEGGTSVL